MLCWVKASEGDAFIAIVCSVLSMLQKLEQIFQLFYKHFPCFSFTLMHPHKCPDLLQSSGKPAAVFAIKPQVYFIQICAIKILCSKQYKKKLNGNETNADDDTGSSAEKYFGEFSFL